MPTQHKNIDSIFDAALKITAPEDRGRFLDQQCREHPEIREEVDRLLDAHQDSDSFLNESHLNFELTMQEDTLENRPSVLLAIQKAFGVNASVVLRDVADASEEPVQSLGSDELPRHVPSHRYQLFGEIARGGMGSVIKGRDVNLGRELAVKVLLDKHKHRPEIVQRFVEEAQIGGQLQHPGITPVYELGQFPDQRPFFTMKLIKGKTLAALLEARHDAESDRGKLISIFEQVCQTMAYAHSRDVIHRDLKPANIMVGAFGEVQVMDWGLAKVLSTGGVADEKKANESYVDRSVIETLRSSGSETPTGLGSQTQMGSVMGTPAYMPPEQALGEIDQLDQRADVFALGAILCEILTGKPPYVVTDPQQLFRLVKRGKLDDCYRRLDGASCDRELRSLAKQCLSPDPNDRPRDAGVLADRISRHQQAVEARLRDSELDRVAQAARVEEERKRRRISVALAAAVLSLVVAVSGGSLWVQARETATAEELAEKNRELAESANALAAEESKKAAAQTAANEKLQRVLYQSDIKRANFEVERGNHEAARQILLQYVPVDDGRDLRGFEWHYLYRLCRVPLSFDRLDWADDVPQRNDDRYPDFYQTISHDGSRIAADIDSREPASRQIAVWSTSTGKKVWSTDVQIPANANTQLVLSHSGDRLGMLIHAADATADVIPQLRIWDLHASEETTVVLTEAEIPNLARLLAFEFRPSNKSIALLFAPNSNEAATQVDEDAGAGNLRSLAMWDLENRKSVYEVTLERPHIGLNRLEFSPSGDLLAVTARPSHFSFDTQKPNLKDAVGAVQIIDASTGSHLRDLIALPFHFSETCAFSPDESKLAIAAANMSADVSGAEFKKYDTLLVWDVESGLLTAATPITTGFSEVKFSRSGEFIALIPRSRVNSPEVIRVANGAKLLQVDNQMGGIVHFSEDERYLQTLDRQGTVHRWKIPVPLFEEEQHELRGQHSLSGDGKRILRVNWQENGFGDANILGMDGSLVLSTHLPWAQMWAPAMLNHDGTIVAMRRSETQNERLVITLSLWDLEHEKAIGDVFQSSPSEQLVGIASFANSPTEPLLAANIRITDIEGNLAPKYQLRIWDHHTLAETTIDLPGESNGMLFSPDGTAILVSSHHQVTTSSANREAPSSQGTLTLYNPRTGAVIHEVSVPRALHTLALSSDGKLVAGGVTAPDGKRFEIWNLQTGQRVSVVDASPRKITFSPEGNRLIGINSHGHPRRVSVLTIWDVETGANLMSRSYFASSVPGWMEFEFLRGEHRLVGGALSGQPQIWDGTPVDLTKTE